MNDVVNQIIREEKYKSEVDATEKQIEVAEKKVSNPEPENFSSPYRVWFQTQKERANSAGTWSGGMWVVMEGGED